MIGWSAWLLFIRHLYKVKVFHLPIKKRLEISGKGKI
jgi:hypothetical protein